jgi:hypothetical protein
MNNKIADGMKAMLDECKTMNAAVMKIILRDKSGKPTSAIIALRGSEETEEVINAIEAIESKWNE